MNGFENVGIQETIKKQDENFKNLEQKKHDDANISAKDDMTSVPDVRERTYGRTND